MMLPPVSLVEFDHLAPGSLSRLHDHVGQQQRERLVADEVARAPDRMAEAERRLLAGEAGLARRRLQPLQPGELLVLPRCASVSSSSNCMSK